MIDEVIAKSIELYKDEWTCRFTLPGTGIKIHFWKFPEGTPSYEYLFQDKYKNEYSPTIEGKHLWTWIDATKPYWNWKKENKNV